jgi:hypothetical protein
VGGRHADVDNGQVGAVGVDGRDQAGAVADLGDDLDPAVGQQPGQALAQQDGVLGDHDPHGGSPLITEGILRAITTRTAAPPGSPSGRRVGW